MQYDGNLYLKNNATWHLHDPSNMMEKDGILTLLGTAKENADGYKCGLESWYMFPQETGWRPGNCFFKKKPSWWQSKVGEDALAGWAPEWMNADLIYYSITNGMESPTTCVGAARVTGTAPNLELVDIGKPVTCTLNSEDNWNVKMPGSIDPATFIDGNDAYIVYGGGYTYLTKVDLNTGLQAADKDWQSGSTEYTYLASGPKTPVSTSVKSGKVDYQSLRRFMIFLFSHHSSQAQCQVKLANIGKKHHTFSAEKDFTISF